MEGISRIQRWFGTAADSAAASGSASQSPQAQPDLEAIRSAMTLAIGLCSESRRLRAALRIELATSALDLWLLRADIFQYLAQDLGQRMAAQQITRLTPLFEGLVPGVAAARKSPDNLAHERYLS